jgi:hypothetical protein
MAEKRTLKDRLAKDPDYTKKTSAAVKKRRIKLKVMAVEYKGGKCSVCGYNKCIAALDFHHLDASSKEFSISADGSTRGWERLKVELDKCILVCSNCHREIHHNLRINPV